MKYGLIGERLAHSFSAEIHPKIADYEYELKEIAPSDVKSFIEAKDFCGINVTIPYKQSVAYDLSKEKHLIIICGHYEGFDDRIESLADYIISIGDYVLTGGEIPAMVLADSITRLIPGVITEDSHIEDSFNENNLLDYPTYTKPADYKGMKVPDVLISGDHKKIEEYRYQESIRKTKELRPDLLKKGDLDVCN
jgi:tRNA (guanine37-N1)-methyltransferase